ncbi:MAG: hypothetical protein GTO42_05565 [Candidatus Latescibacteria bacterium]|nr:hypothetical protein [Candidatus Latescibacterota bacterium]NIO01599.1 hypothetical protein [Candidatus Latescibacterota bacterium]NIO77153.1 hypothetical protein [Candidatus Latescibacterota bacterium]
MLCKICGTQPAQIHYTEIVNNKVITTHLCADCAKKKGIDVQKGGPFGVGDLMATMIGSATQSETEKIGKVHCPFCGYDYSDFKKIGRFGCPDCYEAFGAQLIPLLRQIHGRTQHKGKTPTALGPQATLRKELMGLKDMLNQAVENEEYEKAAEIRDKIKEIETKAKESKDS